MQGPRKIRFVNPAKPYQQLKPELDAASFAVMEKGDLVDRGEDIDPEVRPALRLSGTNRKPRPASGPGRPLPRGHGRRDRTRPRLKTTVPPWYTCLLVGPLTTARHNPS